MIILISIHVLISGLMRHGLKALFGLSKQYIIGIEYQWHKNLPIEQQLFLHEIDWEIKNSGEPYSRDKNIGIKDNLKGFFLVMEKIFPRFKADFNSSGWNNVVRFFSIRDGIMHPNSPKNLQISKEDIIQCDEGREWLTKQFRCLINEFTNKTRNQTTIITQILPLNDLLDKNHNQHNQCGI